MALTNQEFYNKYKENIEGIAKYNNVSNSVAQEMFEYNLSTSGTGGHVYKGGGVVPSAKWGEMVADNKNRLKPYETKEDRETVKNKNNPLEWDYYSTSGGGYEQNNSSNNISNSNFSGGGFGGIGLNSDTLGVITGVGVLYMFLSIFRRR